MSCVPLVINDIIEISTIEAKAGEHDHIQLV